MVYFGQLSLGPTLHQQVEQSGDGLPLALPQYRDVRIGGEVIYPTHTVRVPRGALLKQFIEDLGALIRRLASDVPPQRVPSAQECRYCDITTDDCPERVDESPEPEGGTTDDF